MVSRGCRNRKFINRCTFHSSSSFSEMSKTITCDSSWSSKDVPHFWKTDIEWSVRIFPDSSLLHVMCKFVRLQILWDLRVDNRPQNLTNNWKNGNWPVVSGHGLRAILGYRLEHPFIHPEKYSCCKVCRSDVWDLEQVRKQVFSKH